MPHAKKLDVLRPIPFVIRRQLALRNSEAFQQLVRFGIAGGGVAVISVFVYWATAVPLRIHPLLANLLSYLTHISLGFMIHRAWTFREFTRDDKAAHSAYRYFAVSLIALAMNTVWTAALTQILHEPAWTPILPMVLVTPLVTFLINRHWVFKASGRG
jgi:putative flippase GtrA